MNTFEVLADDTRRAIVERLAQGNLHAGAIADSFTISQPAVSRHLRILRDAGLVRVHKQAQQRVYQLEPSALRELAEWVSHYTDFWDTRLTALAEHLENQTTDRTTEEPR